MRRFQMVAWTVVMSFLVFTANGQDLDFDQLLNDLAFDTTPVDSSGQEVASPEISAAEDAPAAEPVIEPAPADDDFFGMDVLPDEVSVIETTPEPAGAEPSFGEDLSYEPTVEQPVDQVPSAVEAEPVLTGAPASEAVSEAVLLAQQEEVRRQAKEVAARKNFDDGLAAIDAGKYDDAARLLESAYRDLPVRPKNDKTRERIRITLGGVYYDMAKDQMDNDLVAARKSIDLALQTMPGDRDAMSLEKRIATREARAADKAGRPVPVGDQPKYSARYTQIDDLLREGRDFFDAKEYNDAENAFENVLLLDEYNLEAMRFLRAIEDKRYELRTKEREATVSEMMANVRDTWNPPIRTDVVPPAGTQQQTQIDALTAQQKLQRKMEGIIIPFIEFRQANIADVVNFLVDASVAGDPDGIGVNIILKLASGDSVAPSPAPAPSAPAGGFDDFGFGGGFDSGGFDQAAAPASAPSGVPSITLNLRRINLLDAIKYITEVADLRFRIEDNVVVITPANVVSGRVVTRMYPVQPSILDVIVERAEPEQTDSRGTGEFIGMSQQTSVKRSDVKEFFERAGVPFPVGTSITYNQSISQLIVANTVENLETFERILSRLNVIPNQVEIEARFVEVNQNNLEELGFQWFLTDNWEIAQKDGGAFLAGTQTIQMNADSQGITKGNRFFGADLTTGAIDPISTVTKNSAQAAMGGVATFASVLTNPELQVVINALSQKGNADLLSAPRVTTRSGVNAQIQVVNEIIYPTEFDSEVITIRRELEGGGTTEERFVTVTPGTFATREVGVILNVTPTVGPDGYTIDLILAPEVAELVDWIQYGSSYGKDAVGDPIFSNIPQPTFASRKVSTSIVVWDGQTVVMGGLIREDLVKYNDKIPILGDIPLLGWFFRSKGEYSQKKNLLIFVTARLVGPDGRPIQRGDQVIPGADTAEAVVAP